MREGAWQCRLIRPTSIGKMRMTVASGHSEELFTSPPLVIFRGGILRRRIFHAGKFRGKISGEFFDSIKCRRKNRCPEYQVMSWRSVPNRPSGTFATLMQSGFGMMPSATNVSNQYPQWAWKARHVEHDVDRTSPSNKYPKPFTLPNKAPQQRGARSQSLVNHYLTPRTMITMIKSVRRLVTLRVQRRRHARARLRRRAKPVRRRSLATRIIRPRSRRRG